MAYLLGRLYLAYRWITRQRLTPSGGIPVLKPAGCAKAAESPVNQQLQALNGHAAGWRGQKLEQRRLHLDAEPQRRILEPQYSRRPEASSPNGLRRAPWPPRRRPSGATHLFSRQRVPSVTGRDPSLSTHARRARPSSLPPAWRPAAAAPCGSGGIVGPKPARPVALRAGLAGRKSASSLTTGLFGVDNATPPVPPPPRQPAHFTHSQNGAPP
jgi:hypothetical protein